ncbi:MAG: hypothetical protein P5681_23530 [Limnospira sp. PMC 894.15]|nr:hypothetical protein [Limnospira sp. PMC 894.15]MDT9190742.1 hypothetical protein [Limnospira sp. PMC 894.15]
MTILWSLTDDVNPYSLKAIAKNHGFFTAQKTHFYPLTNPLT